MNDIDWKGFFFNLRFWSAVFCVCFFIWLMVSI
jgi:hypothetical protein